MNTQYFWLQATDPDVRETETLQYSLVEPSSLLGVEPSTGQVYVVSASSLSGVVSMQVKAEDQGGLYGVTTVEVWESDFSFHKLPTTSLATAQNAV